VDAEGWGLATEFGDFSGVSWVIWGDSWGILGLFFEGIALESITSWVRFRIFALVEAESGAAPGTRDLE
jgi:hypothetical protein